MEQFTKESLAERMSALPAHVVYGQATGRKDWGDAMLQYIPQHMHGGLVRWIVAGIQPGDFLCAVIQNDMMEALGRADETNRPNLHNYGMFLYNYAPGGSFGSVENFANWSGMLLDEDE